MKKSSSMQLKNGINKAVKTFFAKSEVTTSVIEHLQTNLAKSIARYYPYDIESTLLESLQQNLGTILQQDTIAQDITKILQQDGIANSMIETLQKNSNKSMTKILQQDDIANSMRKTLQTKIAKDIMGILTPSIIDSSSQADIAESKKSIVINSIKAALLECLQSTTNWNMTALLQESINNTLAESLKENSKRNLANLEKTMNEKNSKRYLQKYNEINPMIDKLGQGYTAYDRVIGIKNGIGKYTLGLSAAAAIVSIAFGGVGLIGGVAIGIPVMLVVGAISGAFHGTYKAAKKGRKESLKAEIGQVVKKLDKIFGKIKTEDSEIKKLNDYAKGNLLFKLGIKNDTVKSVTSSRS